VKKSDVLVYNVRPQAMTRLKLSYEEVKTINPKIIYVGCFGYSQRGPNAAKAAYDDMIQGASGIPWLLHKQGAPEPRYAPMIVADRSVGQQVASAVSAALYHREKTGEGQRVDVPMYEHLLQMILGDHLGGYTFDPAQGLRATTASSRPTAGPTRRKDGYVCALIYNDKQWKGFLELIGKPEMFRTKEYATQEARSQNYVKAYAFVAEELKKRSHRRMAGGVRARRHPGAAHEQPRRYRRRPAPRRDRLSEDRRAPERRAHPVLAVPSEWSASGSGIPPPRTAPRRAHPRGAARGGAVRGGDRPPGVIDAELFFPPAQRRFCRARHAAMGGDGSSRTVFTACPLSRRSATRRSGTR
jgi:crotonobetainyl-CoA:carnitine CoA-transferase CaiB-like acyl-CoA transferase